MTQTEAGIDLAATIGAHVSTSLGKALSPLAAQLSATAKALNRPPYVPIYSRLPRQDVVDANGNATLGFGGPPEGAYWNIRQIILGGSDPSVAPGGVAYVFTPATNPKPLGLAGIGMADWRDFSGTLPALAWYSPGDLTVHSPSKLYIMFANGTPGALVSGVIQLEQHEQAALPQVISQ